MFRLSNLIRLFIPWISNRLPDVELTGLQLDSRSVKQGNLFVAIKGYKDDGRLYINHAISKGAAAILVDSNNKIVSQGSVHYINSVPIIHIWNISKFISEIAGYFYNHPSKFLNLIGVTGTNGKTTITCLLAYWMQLLGEKSAIMGTLGYGILNDFIYFSKNTTCSSIENQKILRSFVKDRVKFVFMEVSSHGLAQYRADALYFKVAIFSNLSHDHLDYHGNFMQYMVTKRRFFEELHVEQYVINADDYIGHQWLSYYPQSVAVTIYGNLPKGWKGRWISVINVKYELYKTSVFFHSSWGTGTIYSPLLGSFNVSNLLLALGALLILEYPLPLLLRTLSYLKPVFGRMEIFQSSYVNPIVIVDYAHTPDALKKALIVAKQFCYNNKLWCVFGCGGDRDKNKRALMGIIAEQYSDRVIITNDNPRMEDPKSIINDILQGMVSCNKLIKIIEDRTYAIETAILNASSGDLVLVSGKGHEQYQIVENNCVYHSDREIIQDILKSNVKK